MFIKTKNMDHVDKIIAQWNKEKPELDVTSMEVIGRIKRIFKHLDREMEKTFNAHGMNAASFDVLATLRRSGPPYTLSPGDMMGATMVTSGTMTNRIDQLVKEGLVERIRNPKDGRGFIISLTKKGFVVIEAAIIDHVETQNNLLSVLSKEDRESLNSLNRKFIVGLDQV